MRITLWYCPFDTGDGCVQVEFYKTKEEAITAENNSDGYAESVVDSVKVDVEDSGFEILG